MRIYLYSGVDVKLKVDPDPATVRVGENVDWEFNFKAPPEWTDRINVTIYFSYTNPFGLGRGKTFDHSLSVGRGDTRAVLEAGPAQEPGDYKYGVRVTNLSTNEQISDDDPRLIVRQ